MRALRGWLAGAAWWTMAVALMALCVVVALGPAVVVLWVVAHFIKKVW